MNLAEGYGSTKGSRTARFESAFGSLRETRTGLAVAVALGYLPSLDPELQDLLDQTSAMTWRLLHPR